MKAAVLAAVVACLGGVAAAQEKIRPAELPPASYAGQQYVDSKGCLFLRAGQPGRESWVPRVTRDGAPLCGYPPSGKRVPVADASAAEVAPVATAEEPAPVATGGFYVAVGSFGVAANVEKAEARLKELNYPVKRGRVAALVTVYAGPFADAAAAARARDALRASAFPDAIVVGP